MSKKGFEKLSEALNATTVTEPTQLDEQERQALYTTIYHTDDETRRVWAAERLIDSIRNEEEREHSGNSPRPVKPFDFLQDWKGDYTALSDECEEVVKIVRIIDQSQRRYKQENAALRKALIAMYPEFADPIAATKAFTEITKVLIRFGYTQADAILINDPRQMSVLYEFAKLIRTA